MIDQLWMFDRKTCEATPSVTSSPALAGGVSRLGSQSGPKTSQCGPAPVPASRSPAPEKGSAKPTNGISGPLFSGSSKPSARLSYWVSKSLQKRLCHGSMEYSLTWKERVTPAQRTIFALRASTRRTFAKGFTGAGWPTPTIADTGWSESARQGGENLSVAANAAGWNTPRATDGTNGGPNQAGGALPADAHAAGWATPNAADGPKATCASHNKCLPSDLRKAFGMPPSGTSAATGSNGGLALNPRFSLWLQGYPDAWASCGERAMLSFRRSPPRSSAL